MIHIKHIKWLLWSICITLSLAACNDDKQEFDSVGSGYVQLHLFKDGLTKAVSQGGKLDYLKDAQKVNITLIHDNKTISQTLALGAVSPDAAEISLISEKLELKSGEYTLIGYKIFGKKVIDGQAELLQAGEPDESIHFEVTNGHLSRVKLPVSTQLRGLLAFVIDKDFSNIDVPVTKVDIQDELPDSLFNYEDVDCMEISYYKDKGQLPVTHLFKTKYLQRERLLSTDSLNLPAGKYTVCQIRLFDKDQRTLLLAQDLEKQVDVKDVSIQTVTRDTIAVVYPENHLAIRDYIALYNLWIKMDGPNSWGNISESFIPGANWVFRNRPVDQWGIQPGIALNGSGRVRTLNLGAFNPKGIVPAEIGTFDRLEMLWLGTHSEEAYIDDDLVEMIDSYELYSKGIDIRANRMEIGKEQLALKHPKNYTSKMMREIFKSQSKPKKYSSTYLSNAGSYSNRITGIDKAIGNCKELYALFIANNFVKELPKEIGNLKNLTDLEIYNTEITEIPACLGELSLIAINISLNPHISAEKLHDGLEMLFDSPMNKTLQLLYCTDNNLKKIPENITKMTKIGLLDFSTNQIEGALSVWGNKVAPVQVFLDHNKITAIPDDLCNYDDMESISVSMNQITVFPKISDSGSKYNLLGIDFSNNKINRFSDNFAGVFTEVLNLSANEFKGVLPGNLSETNSKINHLVFSYNQLTKIHRKSILNLDYLQALDCSGNRIDSISYEINTENLPYLNAVDFNNNAFKKFPATILYVSTLNQLYLASQFDENEKRCLKDWPSNIEKHFTLRILDVGGNDIRKVLNFPTMINKLNIEDNPNIEINIPADICNRIIKGTFVLGFSQGQYITGCPALDLGE